MKRVRIGELSRPPRKAVAVLVNGRVGEADREPGDPNPLRVKGYGDLGPPSRTLWFEIEK